MINQIQTIKTFVERQLGDLSPFVTIDKDPQGHEIANGDRASAIVSSRGGRHRITVTSAYIEPPLGRITMIDLHSSQQIEGNKSDAVWKAIEQHIRGNGHVAPAELAYSKPVEAREAVPSEQYADEREPHLGQGVTFYTQRNEPIGGMFKLAAVITEIHSRHEVSLTVFPRTGEQFWRNNVPRKSDRREFFCWEFSDSAGKLEVREKARLEPIIGPIIYLPEGYQLPHDIPNDNVVWLKRKPGRPPKTD